MRQVQRVQTRRVVVAVPDGPEPVEESFIEIMKEIFIDLFWDCVAVVVMATVFNYFELLATQPSHQYKIL